MVVAMNQIVKRLHLMWLIVLAILVVGITGFSAHILANRLHWFDWIDGNYSRELPGGYKLVSSHSNSVEIASPPGTFNLSHAESGVAVGRLVDAIAKIDCIIVGHVEELLPMPAARQNRTSSWFVLDTKTHQVVYFTSREGLEDDLSLRGVRYSPIQFAKPQFLPSY